MTMMASMIAAARRSTTTAKLLERLMAAEARRSTASAMSVSPVRCFNTNAQRRDLDDDQSIDVDRSGSRDASVTRLPDRDHPGFLPDVLYPFTPSRSLSQVLNLMDQMMDMPFSTVGTCGLGAGSARRGWDAREDDNAVYFRIDMPGLSKEHVRITAEQNTLVIKGEGGKEDGEQDDSSVRRYSSRIDLPDELYKMDQIKAEMKNGVLKVVVPKVRKEERKDVFQVQVE